MKNDIEEIKKIYVTKKYGLFKFMRGNRKIDQKKLHSMTEKMKKKCPFTLVRVTETPNNEYEISDGQHTYLALKKLRKPINFYIVPNETIEDVRTINSCMKNWGYWDYVESNAITGNHNYVKLKKLKDSFPEFKQTQLFINLALDRYRHKKTQPITCIKDGTFKFENYDYVLKILDKLRDFKIIINVDYTSNIFIKAILYFLNYEEYKHFRMIDQLTLLPHLIKTNDLDVMIDALLKKYNYKKKKTENIDKYALLSYIREINEKK